jgi:glyoxylase-like metal-dependent hydrolase (beta-lactamase superfamily II)
MTDELVADRLYRLDLGRVNAYLVDTGETTLIDAGTPNAVDDLRAELNDAGYDVEDIDRVLITHFDLDNRRCVVQRDRKDSDFVICSNIQTSKLEA